MEIWKPVNKSKCMLCNCSARFDAVSVDPPKFLFIQKCKKIAYLPTIKTGMVKTLEVAEMHIPT
jgi:hypothetical protein